MTYTDELTVATMLEAVNLSKGLEYDSQTCLIALLTDTLPEEVAEAPFAYTAPYFNELIEYKVEAEGVTADYDWVNLTAVYEGLEIRALRTEEVFACMRADTEEEVQYMMVVRATSLPIKDIREWKLPHYLKVAAVVSALIAPDTSEDNPFIEATPSP